MAKAPNTTTAPTGLIAPFGLRMLPDLREKVEASAKASGRSMNAEIVARLERSFTLDLSQNMPKEPMSNERIAELLAALEGGGVTLIPMGNAKVKRP